MTIADLFEAYGEKEFRALESRVIARLLKSGPRVLSTGGGAFINDRTRALIKQKGLSVWLKADLDVLWERVNKRNHRPLLKTADPKATLEALMIQRYPIYAEADITVLSRNIGKEAVVEDVLAAVAAHSRA
jgi:shikimate kinase